MAVSFATLLNVLLNFARPWLCFGACFSSRPLQSFADLCLPHLLCVLWGDSLDVLKAKALSFLSYPWVAPTAPEKAIWCSRSAFDWVAVLMEFCEVVLSKRSLICWDCRSCFRRSSMRFSVIGAESGTGMGDREGYSYKFDVTWSWHFELRKLEGEHFSKMGWSL